MRSLFASLFHHHQSLSFFSFYPLLLSSFIQALSTHSYHPTNPYWLASSMETTFIKNTAAKTSSRFYGKSANKNVRPPRTPSPKPGQPPMETSPLEPPRLRRSNAIKRMGEALINCRREGARADSPTPLSKTQRPYSFAHVGLGRRDHILTSHTANKKVIEDIDIPPMGDEWTWNDMRRLPGILASFVKAQMPADELGFYLDKLLYGRDNSLGGIVTNLVNENVRYDEIAVHVLKLLDLHDDNGHRLYEQLEPADSDRRPNRPLHSRVSPSQGLQTPPTSPPGWDSELLSYEDPHTNGPEIICPQRLAPRHAALEQESIQRFLTEDTNTHGDGEQNATFADFDFALDNVDADMNVDTDNNSSSSRSDGVSVHHAQAAHFLKPGPARFYSQFYSDDSTPTAVVTDTSIGAMHANRSQFGDGQIPLQLRPGYRAPKRVRRFSRFPID